MELKRKLVDNEAKINVFLVDDDALFLKSLEKEFMQNGNFLVKVFLTGEHCIENLFQNPDVIILDFHLDGINQNAWNGIETLDKITAYDQHIPVIMLSAQDKIEVAINCMHHLAYDYVVKSETAFLRIQKIISSVYRYKKIEQELHWYMDKMYSTSSFV